MATAADPLSAGESNEKNLKAELDGPSSSKPQKEKKIGHRRVDAATGQTTYKKTTSSALSCAIQLGISHTVGGITSKPERDVLLQDFQVVETYMFPSEGSTTTPAHHYDDFRFKTYAPVAFRYFRELFGILPEDYMLSIIREPLVELSNPGASGSLFFVTHDDEFIIKTVQHKEAQFLQELLPGYYMNLVQNPRTLLPKFYGLYCIQAGGRNIRIVVMNNLLPRHIKMHMKFDLKGSTYKRKASKAERAKTSPTYKDLDMLNDIPNGLNLEGDIHGLLMKTMSRDCLVLRSFKIMDYSLLLGIHYVDNQHNENNSASREDLSHKRKSRASDSDETEDAPELRGSSTRRKRDAVKKNTYTDSIMSATLLRDKYSRDLEWSGGIPATTSKGEKLLLFCGIIDILQCYKLKKKLEHTWKAMVHDADTVSVHRPGFYCERFQRFMADHVFKKSPGFKPQSTKRRAQTTKRLIDAAETLHQSPNSRSRNSPATGGAKLSDRPDLLPNESPRPTYNDEDKISNGSHHEYVDSPPRMQIKIDDNASSIKSGTSSATDHAPVTTQPISQGVTSFSIRVKETDIPSSSAAPVTTDIQEKSNENVTSPEQVNLQFPTDSEGAVGEQVPSEKVIEADDALPQTSSEPTPNEDTAEESGNVETTAF